METHTSELEKKYNDVCGRAFVNLYQLSKETKCILLTDIDLKNEEHLFLLHVALGLSGVIEKQVALHKTKFQVWRLNRKLHIKDKTFKIISFVDTEETKAIKVDEVLDFMREYATNLCGPDFTFADIYNEFYNLKKGKK